MKCCFFVTFISIFLNYIFLKCTSTTAVTFSPQNKLEMDRIRDTLKYFKPENREEYLIEKLADANERELSTMRDFRQINHQYNHTVAWISCGRSFRFMMDIFGIVFGHHGGKQLTNSRALSEAFNEIIRFLKERSSLFHNKACQLMQLYGEYNEILFDRPNDRTIHWINRIKNIYSYLKSINITEEKKTSIEVSPSEPNLSDLMLNILTAIDEEESVELFKIQCEYGYWARIEFDYATENDETRKLATFISNEEKQNLIQDYGKKIGCYLNQFEHKFLKDLLLTGSCFIRNKKRHEACAEVFYFGDSMALKTLKIDFDEKWPDLSYARRVDTFCSSFASLYDLVRVADDHVPPPLPYFGIMRDYNSTCYYKFLKTMASNRHQLNQFVFIGKVLGKISLNFTVPEGDFISKEHISPFLQRVQGNYYFIK